MSTAPAASRSAVFGPALAVPLAGWLYLGRPERWAGLGVMTAAGLVIIPLLAVVLVCFAPELPKLAVPRSWRAWYRNRTDRDGYLKLSRGQQKSSHIPDPLKNLVRAVDRYRCVACGSNLNIHVDHRVPWAWGGLTILWNLFILCEHCNLAKVDYWRDLHGREHWGRHFSITNLPTARRAWQREQRARYSLLRVWRLAWAIGA